MREAKWFEAAAKVATVRGRRSLLPEEDSMSSPGLTRRGPGDKAAGARAGRASCVDGDAARGRLSSYR